MHELTRPLPVELAALKQIMQGIAATLGRSGEVVLHDFSTPQNSVVAIAGDVTGRSVGAPMTERLLQTVHTEGDSAADILNVKSRTREGRLVKSTAMFIRDQTGRVIGSLCINQDLTELEIASRVLASHLEAAEEPAAPLVFAADVGEMLGRMVDQALTQLAKPSALLEREEKVELIRALDSRGYFLIRGSVDEVARRLGISRFTVYSYLEECRKEAGGTRVRSVEEGDST